MLFTSALFYTFICFILVTLLLYSILINKWTAKLYRNLPIKRDPLVLKETEIESFTQPKKKRKKTSKNKQFNLYLLSISLIFYGLLNGKFLFLLLAVVTWDYFLSKRIYMSNNKHKKAYLYASLSLNLGILFFYKYAHFLAKECLEVVNKMFIILGAHWGIGISGFSLGSYFTYLDGILLPLGISFFTFQSLSCTIDVYRGKVSPAKSWTDYALYVSFFPQLVAGPIVKAKEFLPQIYKRLKWEGIPLFSAISWIVLGLVKKSILADRLATIVDSVFLDPNALDWAFVGLGVLSYTIQIFLDFSGYSDIAIGIALLFGFRLPKNFNMPYLSSSFSEFWNRWHITLSSWLRDYLYIPLGGNRIGKFQSYRNLFVVMLLGGIWHGASWNFLVWGGLHGMLLAIERMFWKSKPSNELVNPELDLRKSNKVYLILLRKIFAVALVFIITNLLWIFFRSPNWETTTLIFHKFLALESGVAMPYSWKIEVYSILAIVILGHIAGLKKVHPEHWERIPLRYEYSLILALLTIGLTLLSVNGKPFIYFVF